MTDERYFPVIRRFAEYEVWCNGRCLEVAGGLGGEELFRGFGFGFGTVHATLFHVVEVFQTWSGCVGPVIVKPGMAAYDAGMSVGEMAAWHAGLAERFLGAVDAAEAAGVLHLERRLVQVFHLVTHGTHHRTQMITMLRLMGKEPPFEAGDFGGWSSGQG